MALRQFIVKDMATIRTDILRTIKNGLVHNGVENPYVGPASDWHILATALGNELTVIGANTVVKADAQMPDSAVGADLERIAAVYDLAKQPAAGSIGTIVLESSASSPIETGRELTDAAGLRYKVSVGKTYANGEVIPIEAISTGTATNHAEGDVLQWASAPPYAADKALVGEGGLVNGIDAEDDEALRARLFALLQNPPGAGGWEHAVEIAEESTPSVQKGFAHPAIQGPATMHVAVTAAPTEDSKSRVVAAATMNGTVEPYVVGKLPTHAHVVVTTVADVNADVAFAMSIPEAPTANPPGPGGGWKNGSPWPAPDGVSVFRNVVSALSSTTVFTVDAVSAPIANVTRIAWLSPFEWKLYTALVTAVSGSSGAYQVTIDRPFADLAVGCYIWPDSQNAQSYVDAVLAAFALMGPGEKTANASALVRGFRHPIPSAGWPYALGPAMLRALNDAGDEVAASYFLHRTDGASTLTGTSGAMTPAVSLTFDDPPNIYVPRHIAFYRAP